MSTIFRHLAHRHIAPPTAKSGGLRLVFDLEANGLLDAATAVHCIVIGDLDSDQIDEYGPERIADALAHLARATVLTGHNIQNYDLPLLRRLYDWTPPTSTKIIDTLVAGRLILPNIADLDDRTAAMGGPVLKKLRGRYSLEAWGARLGVAKIGVDIEDFSAWTPELQARCVGDVETTRAVYHFLQPDGCSLQAMELEHRVDAICDQIEADGVPFDDAAAERLERRWVAECSELATLLRDQFPDMKNPNSRVQVAKQLEARGWVAEERTEKTGQPKINDELLETISLLHPEFSNLSAYYILRRRIAQLSKGKKAWRKHVGKDGRIHGGIVHIGTPHSRASHFAPNLAQVPNPKRGTPFATECRALFRAPEGWAFVTADQAALQDRTYSHYLAEFDGGAYAKAFLSGNDRHWKGAIILDLIAEGTPRDKQNKVHEVAREGAKGFRYGHLFGAQSKRAGQIISKIARSVQHVDPTSDLHQKFFNGTTRPSEDALRQVGRRALDKFEAGTPGLRQLRQSLQNHARQHGWLPGLDGRRVPVRALYSALNFIVTSAEAVICKRWLAQVHDELRARFRYGWSGDVVITAWTHDGIACCCRSEIAAEVGKIMVRHAKEAGEFYGLKVPLESDLTIGRSWADELIEDQTPGAAPKREDFAAVFELHGMMSVGAFVVPIVPTVTMIEPLVDGKIHCPFHTDNTPSLHIYEDHYHCFGCGAHGPLDGLQNGASQPRPSTQDDEAKRAFALGLWGNAKPIAGTLAAQYLERRGIDLAALPAEIDDVLRFHPCCPSAVASGIPASSRYCATSQPTCRPEFTASR
jgi:DNA polymerase I